MIQWKFRSSCRTSGMGLRKKLGENPKGTPYIETVWGVRYKLNHGM